MLGVLLATRYALQSLGQKILPLISSGIELVGKIIFMLVFIPRFGYDAVILCEAGDLVLHVRPAALELLARPLHQGQPGQGKPELTAPRHPAKNL